MRQGNEISLLCDYLLTKLVRVGGGGGCAWRLSNVGPSSGLDVIRASWQLTSGDFSFSSPGSLFPHLYSKE